MGGFGVTKLQKCADTLFPYLLLQFSMLQQLIWQNMLHICACTEHIVAVTQLSKPLRFECLTMKWHNYKHREDILCYTMNLNTANNLPVSERLWAVMFHQIINRAVLIYRIGTMITVLSDTTWGKNKSQTWNLINIQSTLAMTQTNKC